MKKLLILVLTAVLTLSLAACGSSAKESEQASSASNISASRKETAQNATELNDVEQKFHPASSGSYATIKVDASVKMDDTSAWLGLCPTGKNYITELEADEVDVIWFNADAREDDSDPYVFACDFESVEDGSYALVVCTSDDEAVGYVVIQLAMEKQGDDLKFDYTNAELKERPAK